MFSDTAQYFHSKHLENLPKRHEKHFLSRTDASIPFGRDAKTYQRANNVGVKNPISGKILAKFYAGLSRM